MLYSRAGIFSEWPKPAQPYFLSLGVTTISMMQVYVRRSDIWRNFAVWATFGGCIDFLAKVAKENGYFSKR